MIKLKKNGQQAIYTGQVTSNWTVLKMARNTK